MTFHRPLIFMQRRIGRSAACKREEEKWQRFNCFPRLRNLFSSAKTTRHCSLGGVGVVGNIWLNQAAGSGGHRTDSHKLKSAAETCLMSADVFVLVLSFRMRLRARCANENEANSG